MFQVFNLKKERKAHMIAERHFTPNNIKPNNTSSNKSNNNKTDVRNNNNIDLINNNEDSINIDLKLPIDHNSDDMSFSKLAD